MDVTNINMLFKSRKMVFASMLITLLSLFLCYIIANTGYKSGYIVVGAILYLGLSVMSLFDFRIGFYVSITFGFLIFLLGRISPAPIPLGVLVELPLYFGCINFFLNKYKNIESSESIPMHVITIFMVITTLYNFIELVNINSLNFLAWIYTFRRIIMYGLIYFLSLKVFTSLRDIIFFFKFWIAIAFLAGIYGCFQKWFGLFDFEYNWVVSSPVLEQLFSIGGGKFRIFSIFSDPSAFGLGMATTFIFSLVLTIYTKGFFKKSILFLISIFLLLGVAYSGTRTAYFIIVSGICFYILLTITQLKTLIVACIFFLLFAFILFAPIHSNQTINRIRSTFEFSNDASMNLRNINREKIRPYIYSHPIGGGLSTTGGAGETYTPGHVLASFDTDSGYVRIAVETGWIGLLIQCLFYFFILNEGLKVYMRCFNNVLRFYILGAITCLFSFVIAQYSQDAADPTPLCFLFYPCLAFIAKAKYFYKPLIVK
jgi:putative inorganic carbon (HCO3(-)) transporter